MKPSLPHHQREEEFQALRKNLEEPKPVPGRFALPKTKITPKNGWLGD